MILLAFSDMGFDFVSTLANQKVALWGYSYIAREYEIIRVILGLILLYISIVCRCTLILALAVVLYTS